MQTEQTEAKSDTHFRNIIRVVQLSSGQDTLSFHRPGINEKSHAVWLDRLTNTRR
jgi:hypothetical protein